MLVYKVKGGYRLSSKEKVGVLYQQKQFGTTLSLPIGRVVSSNRRMKCQYIK